MAVDTKDRFGNAMDNFNRVGGDVLVDTRPVTVTLGSFNAETLIDCAGENSASFDLRGTFNLTITASYSVDGTNYTDCPVFQRAIETYFANANTVGAYQFDFPIACKRIRLRVLNYTSGSATVSFTANKAVNMLYAKNLPSNLHITSTAAVGVVVTAIVPGFSGLFHYITNIKIEKFAVALLTAGATPVLITTSNLSGARAYSIDASAQAQGTILASNENIVNPIKSSASGTNTVFTAPATPNVIWRISIDYYLGA
jgi:hypothetical protein